MKKKKVKKLNSYDFIFDALIKSISESELDIFSDPNDHKLFNVILQSQLELEDYKNAFIKGYIPKANESYKFSIDQWESSKISSRIKLPLGNFKETLNETIRLGYIGLFHKYEAFVTTVLGETNRYFQDAWESEISIEKFTENEFGVNLKSWKINKTIERINYISNSCKHYDGKPKQPKHKLWEFHPNDMKIVIPQNIFKSDCETLIQISRLFISVCLTICSYRMLLDIASENNNLDKEKMYNDVVRILENFSKL